MANIYQSSNRNAATRCSLTSTVLLIIATVLLCPMKTWGQKVRWHNEATDTLRINELLDRCIGIEDAQERIAVVAREFIDVPYVAGTLECDGEEMLTVNVSEVDCTTLIDNVMALGLTAGEGRRSWRDFVYNLERLRYRGGQVNGYASRLHYISDWVINNAYRDNFEEVTNQCDLATYQVKTINFMTANRDKYAALADSASYAAMRDVETGYRSHRFPVIKTSKVKSASKTFLKTGDVVALVTKIKGLDVSHMGVVIKDEKGIAYLLHASSKAKKVILDKTPLHEYLTRQQLVGIRVFRLKE